MEHQGQVYFSIDPVTHEVCWNGIPLKNDLERLGVSRDGVFKVASGISKTLNDEEQAMKNI
jgi:hypothetical protein